MFGWRSKMGAEEEDRHLTNVDELKREELAVLFKHSSTCGVSWAAQTQVKKFEAANPDIPVYTISVRQDRELSRQIAQETRIRHESPQVIVFRRGVPVANASHQDVTVDFLSRAVRQ
ncbi:MAG TPA: bacillithiol system redox-active protein YtxJ [Bryobacteraceae bacterium]|nr:bacillithiol system redox-active protein YtxJ [Bryobacteraceae bacterium]